MQPLLGFVFILALIRGWMTSWWWALIAWWVVTWMVQWMFYAWSRWVEGIYCYPPMPVVGVNFLRLLRFIRVMHMALYEEMQRSGHNYWFTWMWHATLFHVSDAVMVRQMLVTKQPVFERSWWEMMSLDSLGGGLILAPNEKAKATHGVFARMFSRVSVNRMVPVLVSRARELVAAIPRDGSPVDMQHLILNATFSVILDKVFGAGQIDAGRVRETREHFDRVLRDAQNRIAWPFPRLPWAFQLLQYVIPRLRSGAQAKRALHELLQQEIGRERERKEPSDTVLGSLIAERRQGPYFETDQQIIDEVFTILFAGHDTTANMLVWALYYLACDPERQERARQEVALVCGEGAMVASAEHVDQLVYIRNCLKEALRLRPSAPVRGRTTLEDVTLMGGDGKEISLKAGQIISFSIYNIHHQELYWGTNVESFVPERFEQHEDSVHGQCKGEEGDFVFSPLVFFFS